MKGEDLKAFAPEHVFNKENIMVIKYEKSDSLEIKEDAKGNLHYVLKVYGNIDDPDFIGKVNALKLKVEKEVLKRV